MLCSLSVALCLSLCDFKNSKITVLCVAKHSHAVLKSLFTAVDYHSADFWSETWLALSFKCLVGHPRAHVETCTSTQSPCCQQIFCRLLMWNASWWHSEPQPVHGEPNKAALSLLSRPASTHGSRDHQELAHFFCSRDLKKQSRNKLFGPSFSLFIYCIVVMKPVT